MNLREAAINRHKEQVEENRQRIKNDRQRSLETMLSEEKWTAMWNGRVSPPPAAPGPEEVTWASVLNDGARQQKLTGWRFVIDDVHFLKSETYGHTGLYVILTCPECGVEHAESFYGMDQLGKLLERSRGLYHRCRESAAKTLAYQLGQAARDGNASVQQMLDLAMDHQDVIYRAMR